MRTAVVAATCFLWMSSAALAVDWTLDETPAGDGEWGYRPAEAARSETSPPSFSWRPQSRVTRWELQCASRRRFRYDRAPGDGHRVQRVLSALRVACRNVLVALPGRG